jgi:hypothetical protein
MASPDERAADAFAMCALQLRPAPEGKVKPGTSWEYIGSYGSEPSPRIYRAVCNTIAFLDAAQGPSGLPGSAGVGARKRQRQACLARSKARSCMQFGGGPWRLFVVGLRATLAQRDQAQGQVGELQQAAHEVELGQARGSSFRVVARRCVRP